MFSLWLVNICQATWLFTVGNQMVSLLVVKWLVGVKLLAKLHVILRFGHVLFCISPFSLILILYLDYLQLDFYTHVVKAHGNKVRMRAFEKLKPLYV